MHIHSRSFSSSIVKQPVQQVLANVQKDHVQCASAKSISFSVGLLASMSILCLPVSAKTISVEQITEQTGQDEISLSRSRLSRSRLSRRRSQSRQLQNGQFQNGQTQSGQSESQEAQSKEPRNIRFQPGTPPPDRGTPPAPYGTGSRGSCLQNANMPPLIQLSGSRGLDLTVSDHPSFWVYVPYDRGDVSTALFSLQKDNAKVYQQSIQLPTTPGIVEIAMPTTLPALEAGKSYRWYFEIGCPQIDPSETPIPATVTGLVQRVASSEALESDLAIAQSPLEEVEAYANHHIWHETLSSLAQLRQSDPTNQSLAEIWQNMLSDPSVGLENWANLPIVGEAIAIRTDLID